MNLLVNQIVQLFDLSKSKDLASDQELKIIQNEE